MFTAGKRDFKEHWALNSSRYPASVEGMKWTELKTHVSGGSTKTEGGNLGTFCEYLNLGSVHTYLELMWKNKSNQLTALSLILHPELPSRRGLPLVEIPDKQMSLSAWFQAWRAILAQVDSLHTARKASGHLRVLPVLTKNVFFPENPCWEKQKQQTNEKVFLLNFFLFACKEGLNNVYDLLETKIL